MRYFKQVVFSSKMVFGKGNLVLVRLYGEAREMRKFGLFLAATFAALLVSAPLLAHHGEANYDTDKVVSVKGTVSDFEFINPHTLITLDVKNDKGEIEKWDCEMRSPTMLVRVGGWDKNTLKPGDVITVFGFRAKNGTTVMRLQKLTLADGTVKDNL
jgi:Family of unknown function (DUF6152)